MSTNPAAKKSRTGEPLAACNHVRLHLFPPFKHTHAGRSLAERLAAGESVLAAEGYVLALARMGYLAHGVWVPEVILDHPEVLRSLHYEFIHAGSDVTEAFQVIYISSWPTISQYQLNQVLVPSLKHRCNLATGLQSGGHGISSYRVLQVDGGC